MLRAKTKKEPFFPMFKLYLMAELIFSSFCQLMKEIYDFLARCIQSENSKLPPSQRIPEFVNGIRVTPTKGGFLVQLIPKESAARPVTLLFRCNDLYMDSFHYNDVWYRFSDNAAELPPREQLYYRLKGGIVILPISSTYSSIGGAGICIGRAAFNTCYDTLRKAGQLYLSEQGLRKLRTGPLATPVVGISEAIRFRFQQVLVNTALRSCEEVLIDEQDSQYFTQWGSFSTCMYTKERPRNCFLSMTQISNELLVMKRIVNLKEAPNKEEIPVASLRAWNNEDEKIMLHAVCNVGDIDHSVKFYSNCFAMSLLRKRDVPTENRTEAFVGFGTLDQTFKLKLDKNHGRKDYDLGEGFGHFSIASDDKRIKKIVKKTEANGGKTTKGVFIVDGRQTESTCIQDPDSYKFELMQQKFQPSNPLCKLMLHSCDVERSIQFYQKALGMSVVFKKDMPECELTTVKLGYADNRTPTVLEIQYKYSTRKYKRGTAYVELVIGTTNLEKSTKVVEWITRTVGGYMLEPPDKIEGIRTNVTSFVDPDGWKVVLVDTVEFLREVQTK